MVQQHGFSPKQMCADDERDRHSLRDGFVTKENPERYVFTKTLIDWEPALLF